jgi:hypothetical protein
MNRHKSPSLTTRNWEALVELDIASAEPFSKARRFRPVEEFESERHRVVRSRANFHRSRMS